MYVYTSLFCTRNLSHPPSIKRESDCLFTFDFREVYWNSRLSAEHERLIHLFKPEGGIVADVMAGVGPFAVPAAKRGCAVLANDLNPACAKWHRKNMEDNNASFLLCVMPILIADRLKVSENLRVFCEDGRSFIRASFKRAFEEPFPAFRGFPPSKRKQNRGKRQIRGEVATKEEGAPQSGSQLPDRNRIEHFVMNLPDTAIEFLDAFRGVMSVGADPFRNLYEKLPMVHCYCFTRFLDPHEANADIKQVRGRSATVYAAFLTCGLSESKPPWEEHWRVMRACTMCVLLRPTKTCIASASGSLVQ